MNHVILKPCIGMSCLFLLIPRLKTSLKKQIILSLILPLSINFHFGHMIDCVELYALSAALHPHTYMYIDLLFTYIFSLHYGNAMYKIY